MEVRVPCLKHLVNVLRYTIIHILKFKQLIMKKYDKNRYDDHCNKNKVLEK